MATDDAMSVLGGSGLSQREYEVLFDAAPDAIVVVDKRGRITAVNARTESMFGYERGELIGQEVELLVPESMRVPHTRLRGSYTEHPSTRPMGIGLELSARHKQGTQFPVEISLSAIESEPGVSVIAIIRDVRERKRLRAFGRQALRAMEAERKRVALELHDETIQTLVALLIRLKVAQRNPAKAASPQFLDELRSEIAEAAEGVRRMAGALRPPELDALGVGAAIESHARLLSESTSLPIRVEVESKGQGLSQDVQLALYRIVQEALSNTLRHAQAQRATVRLRHEGGSIVVEIEDDGTGFDVLEVMASDQRGLGLFGILERAAYAGGRAEFDSRPGEGTRVIATFPVEEPTSG
jgi:PAS domain S-box-containing protein